MKPITIKSTIIILCFILIFACNKNGSLQNTKVVFNKHNINLGKIKVHDTCKVSVPIKNIGLSPYIIQDIKTSCGCTDAQVKNDTIYPSYADTVFVFFSKELPTQFGQTIEIVGNSDSPVMIHIYGEVVE